MARSDRRHRTALFALFALAIPACAQITGLSDEYRYDLEAGAPSGSGDAASGDGGGADTAPADAGGDARGTCGPAQRTEALADIQRANGSEVPLPCRNCLAASCCGPIDTCAGNNDCEQSMRCVFGCQNTSGGGNSKSQCLNNCRNAFQATVGTCIATNCAGICQLGP